MSYVAVAAGFFAGIWAVFLLGRRIVAPFLRNPSLEPSQRTTIVRMAAAGGFVGILPSLLLGTVVGGTLGARLVPHSPGISDSLQILGIAFGMFAVVTILMCGAIALGAWIGAVIARGE